MSDIPTYLGMGRGRGRGRGVVSGHQAPGRQHVTPSTGHAMGHVGGRSSHADMTGARAANDRFQAAASQHQKAALHHLQPDTDNGQGDRRRQNSTEPDNYLSDEDDDDDDDDDDEQILAAVLNSFSKTSQELGPNELGSTQGYLTSCMKPKASVCLVCIESIGRLEPIWSCQGCYTMFHIGCIQKWVKDGAYQQSIHDDNLQTKSIPWNCPKCRHEYAQSECPKRYMCFCGKQQDPPSDLWLVPHSCGQHCGKTLRSECGHQCLLLCHPGPCPPCPKVVRVTCYCGKSTPQAKRCGLQTWSCTKPCLKLLSCQHHRCQKPCHPSECPPCPQTSIQYCRCQKKQQMCPCANPDWQCQEVCGQMLSCGYHTCQEVCHRGRCGPCPRSGIRNCPCGKSDFELPCTEEVPTCVDTCGKMLECQEHECQQRCHYGPCGACRVMTRKKCRCGKKEKDIQCFKEFHCEVKCTNIKDCGKHSCKRKCCDGRCPPCDVPCGKTLGCRNHKCSSLCHPGRCYPCPLTVTVTCNCGVAALSLPCGGQKLTRPPRCHQPCKRPPDCHHDQRDPHRCHFGMCPPCRQICDKALDKCSHKCPSRCHSAVLMKIQEKVARAGPWEAQPEAKLELRQFECPPCQVPVMTTCLGKHETLSMPCYDLAVRSCHRACGRLLPCSNHRCQLECHTVEGAADELTSGVTCGECEEACDKPRPEGCSHPCLLPCHPKACPPCTQRIRMRCHCQQLVLHPACDEWSHADDTERARLQSCHSPCPKLLKCRHKCHALCHPGTCPDQQQCVEKVTVRCPCRKKKQLFLCNDVQAGYAEVTCDETCQSQGDSNKQEVDVKSEESLKAAKKEQEEIEAFQRRLEGRGRRRRNRKDKQQTTEPHSALQKYVAYVLAPLMVVLLAVFVYWLINM